MNKITFSILFIFIAQSAFAQVEWSFTSKRILDKEYELRLTAKVDEGWHTYAQEQPENSIAQPTVIKFNRTPLISLIGKVEERGQKEFKIYQNLGIEAYQYGGTVIFAQRIKLKNKIRMTINGKLTYQACTEESCLVPETLDFSIKLE